MRSLEISPLDSCYCLFKNPRPEFVPTVKPFSRGRRLDVAPRRSPPPAVRGKAANEGQVKSGQRRALKTTLSLTCPQEFRQELFWPALPTRSSYSFGWRRKRSSYFATKYRDTSAIGTAISERSSIRRVAEARSIEP